MDSKSYEEVEEFSSEFFSKSNEKQLNDHGIFSHAIENGRNLFLQDEFKNYKKTEPFKRFNNEDIIKLNEFLKILLPKDQNKKSLIKNKLKIFLLDTTILENFISFENILVIIKYKIFIRESEKTLWFEFFSNLLDFFLIYYLKKKLFLFDRIKCFDLEHTSTLFRYNCHLKSRCAFEKIIQKFKIDYSNKALNPFENKNIVLELVKISLDRLIINTSELWELNESRPHVLIFKIINILYEYNIWNKKESKILMDVLCDKLVLIKNYEGLLEQESNSLSSKKESPQEKKVERDSSKKDEISKKKTLLCFWGDTLKQIRQNYSTIVIQHFLKYIDIKMVNVFKNALKSGLMEDFNGICRKFKENIFNEESFLKAIKKLEDKIKFEQLGIFDQKKGSLIMRIFFDYILVNPENELIRINHKIKLTSNIFLSLFANINDVFLDSVKLMTKNSVKFLELSDETANINEKEEDHNIIKCCENFQKLLNSFEDKKKNGYESLMLQSLNELFQLMNYEPEDLKDEKVKLDFSLFKNNFFWIFLNIIVKSEGMNKNIKVHLKKLFEKIMSNNIFFQNNFTQKLCVTILEGEIKRNNFLIIELIIKAFEIFPNKIISNIEFLNLFMFLIKKMKIIKNDSFIEPESEQTFVTEDEFLKNNEWIFEILLIYLKDEFSQNLSIIPEYDLIILHYLLDFIEQNKEFLNILDFFKKGDYLLKKNEPKLHFFITLLTLLGKSSSRRIAKEASEKLKKLFEFSEWKKILDFDFSKDLYKMKIILFRLLRNIYIFEQDNSFDDEKFICGVITPPPIARNTNQGGANNNNNANNAQEEEKGNKRGKEQGARNDGNSNILNPVQEEEKGNKGGRGQGGRPGRKGASDSIYLSDFLKILEKKLQEFIKDSKNPDGLDEKKDYGGNMLISTVNFMAKNYLKNKINAIKMRNLNPRNTPESQEVLDAEIEKVNLFELILKILQQNIDHLNDIFQIKFDKNFKKEILFQPSEVESIKENQLKKELHDINDLVNLCNRFKEGDFKSKYNVYNQGLSIEMVKRFSNKLEDRQEIVYLPYQMIKNIFIKNNKKFDIENFGILIGTFYESYKLKKLSTFSSAKKNFEEDADSNVYFKILKDSEENNDSIAKNLCKFLYFELNGKNYNFPIKEKTNANISPELVKTGIIRGSVVLFKESSSLSSEKQEGIFINGERNKKYIYLEIFSNVLFHATSVIQTTFKNIIQTQSDVGGLSNEFLNFLWKELVLNFSFVFNRERQDKLWKEFYIRTILLIKFHQYLAEEDNIFFKTLLNEQNLIGFDKENDKIAKSRLGQLSTFLQKFFLRCDWGKNDISVFKKSNLFHIANCIFDFLAEMSCGPMLENQKILSDLVEFKYLSSFLSCFEAKTQENDPQKILNLNSSDSNHQSSMPIERKNTSNKIDNQLDKQVSNIDFKQFMLLKLSMCDYLLMLCEGNSKIVMENQIKKVNFYEILDAIIYLVKSLTLAQSESTSFNYQNFKLMSKNYKNSLFKEDETLKLNLALKLYMYLKNLSEHSVTLSHMLEKKEKIASEYKKDKSKSSFFNFSFKKPKQIKNIGDFEEGLCLLFLGKFAKKLQLKIDVGESEKINERTEYIFFEPNPKFSFLSIETKNEFIEKVDRTSHETKILDLINNCMYFEEEINMSEALFKRYTRLQHIFKNFHFYEIFLFLMTILINLIVFLDGIELDNSDNVFIVILAIIEIFFSVLCLMVWFILRFRIKRHLRLLRFCDEKGRNIKQIDRMEIFKKSFLSIYEEDQVRVFLLHIFCSIFGLTISTGFFAMDILSIINLAPTFKYLGRSISSRGGQLLVTFFMAIIFIYIYSSFAFLYFKENLGELCTNAYNCFFSIMNTGFSNGSGLGGMLEPVYWKEHPLGTYFGYITINLLFFISVNCILLNIVFGIIVDTFGELREKSEIYGN